nr:hypothetical protein CFP56_08085 [Quercus suber]
MRILSCPTPTASSIIHRLPPGPRLFASKPETKNTRFVFVSRTLGNQRAKGVWRRSDLNASLFHRRAEQGGSCQGLESINSIILARDCDTLPSFHSIHVSGIIGVFPTTSLHTQGPIYTHSLTFDEDLRLQHFAQKSTSRTR